MPRITEGNRLWFYQLFRDTIGHGRQASVAQVEEVLAAEDVDPEDVECTDVTQLLEALGDLVKLTVFKKGRIYATPLPNEAYDAILERLAAPAEEAAGGKAGSGKASNKPWKRKKGTKDPKPAKPRKRKAISLFTKRTSQSDITTFCIALSILCWSMSHPT